MLTLQTASSVGRAQLLIQDCTARRNGIDLNPPTPLLLLDFRFLTRFDSWDENAWLLVLARGVGKHEGYEQQSPL